MARRRTVAWSSPINELVFLTSSASSSSRNTLAFIKEICIQPPLRAILFCVHLLFRPARRFKVAEGIVRIVRRVGERVQARHAPSSLSASEIRSATGRQRPLGQASGPGLSRRGMVPAMQPDERRHPGAAAAAAETGGPQGAPVMAAARDTAASPQAGGSGAIAPEDDPPRRAAARDRVPWLIALVVFAAYLTISGYRLWRLDPASWDLGVFTEYVKQFAHVREPIVDVRGPGFNMLGDHFDPIVALIAPFFRLFPLPLTLLVAQVALAAVSVIPVSRAAAVKLGTGAGRAIGAAYGFSWGLQQMVNYDFHEIALDRKSTRL